MSENRKAVPYKETPKADEQTAWDWNAADQRLRKWSGVDQDNPTAENWAKYQQAFAWVDDDGGDELGDFKLPHHDIIDGELKVVWRGVVAAMGALLGARGGTSIPSGDQQAVYEHLKKHYEQFQKDAPEFKSSPIETESRVFETRYLSSNLEIRDTNGKPTMTGYAVVYNSTADLGYFTEEIAPGAFDADLQSGRDVRALLNHNSDRPLGRMSKGTLSLRSDDKGLYFELQPPSSAVDVIEGVQRGDFGGCSFAFSKKRDQWSQRDSGKKHRRILDASISEVSICTFPAYEATSVSMRDQSAKRAYEEYEKEQKELQARISFYARRARLAELGL